MKFLSRNNLLIFFFLTSLLNFSLVIFSFASNGYLHQPFFTDINDSFMDLYNPMFQTLNQSDPFISYKTLYSPFVFYFLKILSLMTYNELYDSAYDLRNHNLHILIVFLMLVFYSILKMVFRSKDWDIFSFKEKSMIFIIMLISSPFLYSIERANLILLAILPLSLIINNKNIVLSSAILVNLKIYFSLIYLFILKKYSFKIFCLVILISALIFFIFSLFLDYKSLLIIENIIYFYNQKSNVPFRELMAFPTSIFYFQDAVRQDLFRSYFESKFANLSLNNVINLVDLLSLFYFLIITLSLILFAYLFFIKKDKNFYNHFLLSIILIIITLGQQTGPYTSILLFPFIPLIFSFRFKKLFLFSFFIILLPLDFIYFYQHPLFMESFFNSIPVIYTWKVTAGIFIRPILFMSFLVFLMMEVFYSNTKVN